MILIITDRLIKYIYILLYKEVSIVCNSTRLGRIKYLEFKKLKSYSKN